MCGARGALSVAGMNSRRLIPLAICLLLIAVGPIGSAADAATKSSPPGVGQPPKAGAPTPAASAQTLLGATRAKKARTGLGLPDYGRLLGRKWESKVKKADKAFAAQLAAPAGGGLRKSAATPDYFGSDPLGAADSIKGINAKQTRRLRIETGLDSLCPVHNPGVDADGYWEIKGKARGELVVTTVERLGRYDVTTSVIFDVQFTVHSQTGGAQLLGIFNEDGRVSVTRSQTARDRKTGKTRKTGPTQRLSESLSPLLILDGDFSAFIDQQDKDEAPAPRRPLRSGAWSDLAQRFVAVVYLAIQRDFKGAEQHFRTPNTCLDMTIPHSEFIAPNGKERLHPVPRHKTDAAATQSQLLAGADFFARVLTSQGESYKPLPDINPFIPGNPLIEFTAPPQAWPASNPAGVTIWLSSGAGVAEAVARYRPLEDGPLHFKVLEVSGSVDATDVKTESGQCTFTGSPKHIEVGNPASAASAPHGQLDGNYGSIWTPITHQSSAYSTLNACPTTSTPCDYAAVSLPNQNLGINLRDAGEGKLKVLWSFIAVQLGHSGCMLQVPDLYVNQDLLETTHPLSDFHGSEPFVIETSNSQSYSVKQGISTMSGKLRWNFRMKLQRVREDGSPL